jgi:hypothetical protein
MKNSNRPMTKTSAKQPSASNNDAPGMPPRSTGANGGYPYPKAVKLSRKGS